MSKIKDASKQSNYENIFQDSFSAVKNNDFEPPSNSQTRLYDELQNKFSSPFFQDHIEQDYVIYRAFNCNNFTYLRNLPDSFRRGEILNQRKQKVAKNSQTETINRNKEFQEKLIERQQKIKQKKKEQIGTLGYFNTFDYQESNYEMPKIIDISQRIQNEKKRKEISSLDFRPSGTDLKMKYEDPFRYVEKSKASGKSSTLDSESNYLFPFHLKEDTFDAFHESERRRKIICDSLKLDGDFIPAKQEQTLTKVNKNLLGEIVNEIELFLKKYLNEVGFFIGVTKSDQIQILFEEKCREDNRVSLVMSKICEHEQLSKYLLRRNLSKWAKVDKEKGHLAFSLLPSWVKNPTEELHRK